MKTLLADADRDLLESYGKLLRMEGWEVAEAFDGVQAAALLARGPYDAAILNENLPRVRHEQLMRLMHSEGVPVIALLGERMRVKHLLRPHLAAEYLWFPFLPGDLKEMLDNVTAKARSGERFSRGDAEVDVAGFRISGTDARLTAGEIDLLKRAAGDDAMRGKRARTMAAALNEKLARSGKKARIAYVLEKGYRLVTDDE